MIVYKLNTFDSEMPTQGEVIKESPKQYKVKVSDANFVETWHKADVYTDRREIADVAIARIIRKIQIADRQLESVKAWAKNSPT